MVHSHSTSPLSPKFASSRSVSFLYNKIENDPTHIYPNSEYLKENPFRISLNGLKLATGMIRYQLAKYLQMLMFSSFIFFVLSFSFFLFLSLSLFSFFLFSLN